MTDFMNDDFLITNDQGRYLYHQFACKATIFDYHCHLNPRDIAEDRQFTNIGEMMLEGDHYKWRIMRAFGISEDLITGTSSTPKEKFLAFARALPFFAGNPVYQWVHMELNKNFDIKTPLSEKTADHIWQETIDQLQTRRISACSLIKSANVEFLATTDDPTSDLQWHARIASDGKCAARVAPTWRPDPILDISSETYGQYLDKLAATEGVTIASLADLIDLIKKRMDFFAANGCSIADHGLVNLPAASGTALEAEQVFAKKLAGGLLSDEQTEKFKFYLLYFFACEYNRRNWVMQLHISVVRNQNTRLYRLLGPDAGLDSCGEPVNIPALRRLLDQVEMDCGLPKTILYTMNPSSYYPLATLAGSFTRDLPGKIQLGAAWWMLDHRDGINEQLKVLANTGGLGLSVGMLTDSRSFLSYVRHDYYRRVLCSLIGHWVENGEVPNDDEMLKSYIDGLCIGNARRYFGD